MQTKIRLKNITKLNHGNIQYEGKCFEDNVKKKIFLMKLIFKTKKEERDFIKVFIKMEKFYIFTTGRYSNKTNK